MTNLQWKRYHQRVLVARNIDKQEFLDPGKSHYNITDSYLDQLVVTHPNGAEEVTHSSMSEANYTVRTMEELRNKDKLIYKNHNPDDSEDSEKPKEETLYDVLGKMYPRSKVMANQIKVRYSGKVNTNLSEVVKI